MSVGQPQKGQNTPKGRIRDSKPRRQEEREGERVCVPWCLRLHRFLSLLSPSLCAAEGQFSLSDLVLNETQNVRDLEFCGASMCWGEEDGCFWGENDDWFSVQLVEDECAIEIYTERSALYR